MARMLTQVPLPLLPGDAAEIAPGVGMVTGPDGSGVMWVHGLATFAWDAGDEAGRRLAAVQLWKLKAATQAQVAEAFGVIPVSVWRWERALAAGGVAGLVPDRKGPRRASKPTPGVVARIRELYRQGLGKRDIAVAAGVSESSVRNVLRPGGAVISPEGPLRRAGRSSGSRPGRRPRAGSRTRCRCCLTRWPGTPSGRWPGSGCWGGRRPGVHARCPLSAGRAAAGAARAGGHRAAGVRPGHLLPGAERVLRAGSDAGRAGVPGAAAGAAGRGRDPGPAGSAGPGAGPGPGTGGQDDPPQARRARRGRESRGPDHGAGPPPCRRPAGRARVPLRRRARPRLLRHPAGAEDARGPAKFPGPATEETWVTDAAATRCSWSSPSRRIPGRAAARPAPAAAPGRGGRTAGDGVLRPGRLVTGAVRRHHRRRVRPAHLHRRAPAADLPGS